LLGDGFLEREYINTRIKFKQGEVHKSYLIYLYSLFAIYVTNKPYIEKSYHKIQQKWYTRWTFKTLSFPCFNYYYDLFYINKIKVVPSNIRNLLTPISLAYWAMDDGGYDGVGRFLLFTNNFTKTKVELLIKTLKKCFDLDTVIRKRSTDKYAIAFGRLSYIKLRKIIKPYFHKSILYKLPINK